MFFQHIYEKSLAHSSYLIGCQVEGTAMVIDPKRDIDTYLEIAAEQNLTITHIAETHIHADYLSGSLELAHVTGAKMYLSDEGGPDWQYAFDHVGLKDGDVIKLGNLTFEVMHTPGHTPESLSFLLTDHAAAEEPVMLFTGDFVFVGDIGRPDLLEEAAGLVGTKEVGAQQMFESLKKFYALPDYVQVWPAHGAGSSCGKALGAVANTTIGYEKIRNWAFKLKDNKEDFIQYLLTDQPEAPYYFAKMKQLNKQLRPLLVEVPKIPQLSTADLSSIRAHNLKIIDTRLKADYAKAYLPDTINIQNNKSFNTWMGWMLNYEEQFVLIVREEELDDVTRKLMRIGLDNVYGYFTPEQLFTEECAVKSTKVIDAATIESYFGKEDVQILDVRNETEFAAGHLPGAKHIFVGHLPQKWQTLDPNKKIALYCQSGDRSTIAQSFLLQKGFDVESYTEGMSQWQTLNKPIEK